MNTIFVHHDGRTEQSTRIERAWLNPAADAVLWVDLVAPSIPETLLLSDTFAFHPLAVEDGVSRREHPKIEPFESCLLTVLEDARFFLCRNALVTVSASAQPAIEHVRDIVAHDYQRLGEGAVSLFHWIVDEMVDRYTPRVADLRERIAALEERLFERPQASQFRDLLTFQDEAAGWRHRIAAELDVVSRLSRREFIDIDTDMARRFRDVQDHLLVLRDDVDVLTGRLAAVVSAAPTLVAGARRWL
jgi:magnesium transporter